MRPTISTAPGDERSGRNVHLSERWFDDFTIGDVFEVGPHMMTEERIISFASEFDPQTFHTDPVAAKDTLFGGLVASGWHTGSVLMKLLATTLGEASMGSSAFGDEARPWPTRLPERDDQSS